MQFPDIHFIPFKFFKRLPEKTKLEPEVDSTILKGGPFRYSFASLGCQHESRLRVSHVDVVLNFEIGRW